MDRFIHKKHTKPILIFILLLIQRFIFGTKYFPVIDDWFLYLGKAVQFGDSSYPNPAPDSTTRPFAGLFDHYIITHLSNHLIIIEIFLIIMLILSAVLLWRCFSKDNTAPDSVFIIFITMFPLSFEGLYWISAASRIIPSLFFISLSCYTLVQYIKTGKKIHFVFFIISGVFAVGFYEMFIPLYLTVSLSIIVYYRRYRLAALPVSFAGIISFYYILNSSSGTINQRFSFVALENFVPHIGYTFRQYADMFLNGAHMMCEAFTDGLSAVSDRPLITVFILLISVALAVISKPSRQRRSLKRLMFAVALIISGTALSFIMDFVRLPFRLFLPMSVGLSLAVSELLCSLPKIPYKIITAIFAIVFSLTNIGSLTLYRHTYNSDTAFAEKLLHFDVDNPDKITFVINAPQYHYNNRTKWYEYVKASTENYAPITGQIQYLTQKGNVNNIICLHHNNSIFSFNYNPETMQILYCTDTDIIKCSLTPNTDGYTIINSGKPIGAIIEQDKIMRLAE